MPKSCDSRGGFSVDKNGAIGRLIRLVPDPVGGEDDGEVKVAIKQLLNYRLPADEVDAKEEWLEIVEGTHIKWKKVGIRRSLTQVSEGLLVTDAELSFSRFPPTNANFFVHSLFIYTPKSSNVAARPRQHSIFTRLPSGIFFSLRQGSSLAPLNRQSIFFTVLLVCPTMSRLYRQLTPCLPIILLQD